MIYDIFRWIGIITGYPAQLLFFKRKTYYEKGAQKLSKHKRGALVISNHFNPLDYVMNAFYACPRKLYVIASEFAYQNKLQGFGMKFFGGVETNRNTKSLHFIDESADLLQMGKLVQIFPEGHNTDDGTIKDFKLTYIMIALQAEVPIIPIVTDGNYGFFKRTSIIVGKEIHISDICESSNPTREEMIMINRCIRNKVLELRKELEEKKGR